jgi:hypothetical protein
MLELRVQLNISSKSLFDNTKELKNRLLNIFCWGFILRIYVYARNTTIIHSLDLAAIYLEFNFIF